MTPDQPLLGGRIRVDVERDMTAAREVQTHYLAKAQDLDAIGLTEKAADYRRVARTYERMVARLRLTGRAN